VKASGLLSSHLDPFQDERGEVVELRRGSGEAEHSRVQLRDDTSGGHVMVCADDIF